MTEPRQPTKEEVLDIAAQSLAKFMLHVVTHFKGCEREVAQMMTNQLGAYIAISTKNPQAALAEAADHLGNYDFGAVRAAHFGYATLGVDAPTELKKPNNSVVLQMGDPRHRRKSDE